MFVEDDLLLLSVIPRAASLFGEDTLLAFTRVMAASMARIAEAGDAMFLSDVDGIVVNEPVAHALRATGRAVQPLEARSLRGFDDLVVLWEVGDE